MKSEIRSADLVRLAMHNLWQNKSRTALTTVIVTVVSTLLMVVCVLGISILDNMAKAGRTVFEWSGTEYELSSRTVKTEDLQVLSIPVTPEERAAFEQAAAEYRTVVDRTEYSLRERRDSAPAESGAPTLQTVRTEMVELHWNLPESARASEEGYRAWCGGSSGRNRISLSDFTVADLNGYGFSGQERLLQGRVWNESDNDGAAVWVGSDYAADLARHGIDVVPGTLATFVTVRTISEGNYPETRYRLLTAEVAGIFDSASTQLLSQWGDRTEAKKILIGQGFLTAFAEDLDLVRIHLEYRPPERYDYRAVYAEMKAFVSAANAAVPAQEGEGARFFCSHVDSMQVIDVLNVLVTAVLAVISGLILLLSVGSVVNTILISVDRNRKFLGLLKALGLNRKGIRRMVAVETLTMIVLGVALGVGLLYALHGPVQSLMEAMFSSLFGQFQLGLTVGVKIPFYLPVLTALAFFGFAYLFSRGSVGSFAGRDVIATISEVA